MTRKKRSTPPAETPSPDPLGPPVQEDVPSASAEGTISWDDQPTVNLTGDDLVAAASREPEEALEPTEPPPEVEETPEAPEAEETHDLADDPELAGDPPAVEEGEAAIEQARDLTRAHLRGLLEALVFASDKPMKAIELARLASAPVKQVRELLAELKTDTAGRGVVLDEVAGGWLFRTSAQYAPFVRELSAEKPVRLTRAQVETLAIAAYRQPVTRPEIDDIRGVDSGATLKLLLERDLVRILGKKDEPGRPLLYGTTTAFLEFFGLKSLKDLPTLKEFTELSDESRAVAEAELGDVLPAQAPPPTPLPTDTLKPPDVEHDTLAPPPAVTETVAEGAQAPETPEAPVDEATEGADDTA